jgi:hypothetical protein
MQTTFERQVAALKDRVSTLDVADLLCGPAGQRTGLRRIGDRWTGCCPLPDHEDRTPSFVVYPPDAQGGHDSWFCFGCQRGSDVLDLWMLAHPGMTNRDALDDLALRYGVELPRPRGDRWHEAQDRRVAYLDAAYRTIGAVLCRRTYRTLILPFVDATADPDERERALEETWAGWQTAFDWGLMAEGVCNGREDLVLTLAKVYAEAKAVTT